MESAIANYSRQLKGRKDYPECRVKMASSSRQRIAGIAVVVVLLAAVVVGALILVISNLGSNSDDGIQPTPEDGEHYYKPNQRVIEDYIENVKDDGYAYTVLGENTRRDDSEGFTSYVLNMTSQRWLTPNYSDHSVWWHYVIITVPDVILYEDLGLLFISGGTNDDGIPSPLIDAECRLLSHMSSRLGVVTAVLKQVPNAPITFKSDPSRRPLPGPSIVPYTLRQVLEGNVHDDHFIALCPMVKSVVRAMDTVTNFTEKTVSRFYVSGASERGWVTWLTAAVDDRIAGIAPLVFGNLNFVKNLKHQQRSLDGYSWGISRYWEQNVTRYLDTPRGNTIFNDLDPLSYRKNLTVPKFIVLSSNDEEYMPDCSNYFYQQLDGPVFLRIYPNADNSLLGSWSHITNDLVGFILSMEEKWELPDVRWSATETNDTFTVYVTTNKIPLSSTTWVAVTANGERRDFRFKIAKAENVSENMPQSVLFKQTKVNTPETSKFEETISKPSEGWVGGFVEMVFSAPNGTHFTTTTDVIIFPDEYPVKEECSGDSCIGRLV